MDTRDAQTVGRSNLTCQRLVVQLQYLLKHLKEVYEWYTSVLRLINVSIGRYTVLPHHSPPSLTRFIACDLPIPMVAIEVSLLHSFIHPRPSLFLSPACPYQPVFTHLSTLLSSNSSHYSFPELTFYVNCVLLSSLPISDRKLLLFRPSSTYIRDILPSSMSQRPRPVPAQRYTQPNEGETFI